MFVKKLVMNFPIVLFSNEQPIVFPQLMYIISTESGEIFVTMVSSYQIPILNIDNNFNND